MIVLGTRSCQADAGCCTNVQKPVMQCAYQTRLDKRYRVLRRLQGADHAAHRRKLAC